MAGFGTLTYPGIGAFNNQYDSFDFTDLVGITPAVATITCFLQGQVPIAPNGDLVFNYNDDFGNSSLITLKYMHVDNVAFHAGSGGQTCTIRFLDERWAWEFFYVTGNYNIRLPSGLTDPAHEQTPQALATYLFQQLGVDAFDVSQLPNDARPECDWDNANAAQELEKICTNLGCRIVPVRSQNLWRIVVTGVGNSLPDIYPYQDPGTGVSPKPTPDYLKVVTAPFKFQVCLPVIACARDTNQVWKDIQYLSYKPIGGSINWQGTGNNSIPSPTQLAKHGWEFGLEPPTMCNLSPKRFTLPDGTATSPRELGISQIYKNWRIDDKPSNVAWRVLNPNGTVYSQTSQLLDAQGTGPPTGPAGSKYQFFLPGLKDYVTRKQLMLTSELVESYTDELGVDHRRPAYMFGSFFGEYAEATPIVDANGNQLTTGNMYPPGTRIDKQGAVYQESYEEPMSFSMAIDHDDTDRSIITTSGRLMQFRQFTAAAPLSWGAASSLFIVCAVMVRDPITWQPVRYAKYLQIGNGTNKGFCHVLQQDDIEPWTITSYTANGTPTNVDADYSSPDPARNNKAAVDQMCNYYLQSYAQTFQIVATQTRTYIGLFPIDMDGAISQVQWRLGRGGQDTVVSRGTEHNFQIPTFEQRLQRNATKNKAAFAAYQTFRQDRRTQLLGTSNTL